MCVCVYTHTYSYDGVQYKNQRLLVGFKIRCLKMGNSVRLIKGFKKYTLISTEKSLLLFLLALMLVGVIIIL